MGQVTGADLSWTWEPQSLDTPNPKNPGKWLLPQACVTLPLGSRQHVSIFCVSGVGTA